MPSSQSLGAVDIRVVQVIVAIICATHAVANSGVAILISVVEAAVIDDEITVVINTVEELWVTWIHRRVGGHRSRLAEYRLDRLGSS